VNLCKHCKHAKLPFLFRLANKWEYAECFSPRNHDGIDPVTGGPKRMLQFCVNLRSPPTIDKWCGPEGKWFER
jgi:hypothetical protein